MKIIDCRDLMCPQPVINTKKYFDLTNSKEALVIVDNEVAKDNILRFANNINLISSVVNKNNLYEISLSREEFETPFTYNNLQNTPKSNKKYELTNIVTTNLLGVGDDALGEILMKSYLYALSENDVLPNNLVFLNSGVKLTSLGSTVLDSLYNLRAKGVKIYSCGTCLDYYDLKDKLEVGEIVNMYFIVELMNNSDNTIKI